MTWKGGNIVIEDNLPDIYEFHEERQYRAYNDGAS